MTFWSNRFGLADFRQPGDEQTAPGKSKALFGPPGISRDGSGWINGDRINGLFHLLINGVFSVFWVFWVVSYNPLILTFDPNFLEHPSTGKGVSL